MNVFKQIAQLINESKKTVILTGAGISTESGLPDFRSDDGFWTKNKPIQFSEFIASEEKRRLSWERNIELHSLLKDLNPNLGHECVKKIIDSRQENFLITQNIDGLHQKTGTPINKTIEIHGNATEASCLDCGTKQEILNFHIAIKNKTQLPRCSSCKGIVKVATISFGQPMIDADMAKASKLSMECNLMIVIGSSLKVMPTGKLPGLAIEAGAKVIIFNREKTRYDSKAEIVVNDELKTICSKLLLEL